MTTKTFYGIALTSPLWLPLLLRPLAPFDVFRGIVDLLALSLLYCGIPYLIFLGGVFFFFKKRSGQYLREAATVFPVIFVGLLLLGLGILGTVSSEWQGVLVMSVYFITFGILFGYAYVVLTEMIYKLLNLVGFISDFDANDTQPLRLELQ